MAEKRFEFAIVMAIYNTGDYLNQAIDSIVNQTIGFEDNVQLILVNDGSEDNCGEICLGYQERFPDNIVVLNQENAGQAAARNNGFEHVNAKYVNFADSDDFFSLNALEEVYGFFEEHFDETDVVSIPITFFGRLNEGHMLNGKFHETRVIDLNDEPDNPQLHTNSAFIKSDVFSKYDFPTNVISSEDVIVLTKILLEKPFLGVVNSTEYFLRKRFDESSTIDNVSTQREFFTDKLKDYYLYLFNYAKENKGDVPKFVQYSLVYDLQWVVREDLSILSPEEVEEFYHDLYEVLDFIDLDVILNSTNFTDERYRQFLAYLKTGDLHTEVADGDVLIKIGDYLPSALGSHRIWFDIVDIRDDRLRLSGFLNSIIDYRYLSIQAIKYVADVEVGRFDATQVKYTARHDVYFLDKLFQYKFNFDVEVPLKKGEISKVKLQVTYHKDANNKNFDSENIVELFLRTAFTTNVKISELSKYKISKDNILYYNNYAFNVIPNSFKSHVKREMDSIDLLKSQLDNLDYIQNEYGLTNDDLNEIIKLKQYYLATLPYWRGKTVYLFQDRINEADDNAYHLFKYAASQKDKIKKYFVVSRESKQFKELSKIGNVVEFGSKKHKLLMLHADKVITTHPYDSVINPFYGDVDLRPLISGLLNYKIYWLQHGVTKDNISSWMYKYEKDLSLIVTVSDKESKSFLEEGYGYDESIIQNLGFPRFDNLQKKDKKQILIIPTWRKYLKDDKQAFLESDYFANLTSLLNNFNLVREGYKVAFKPHPELVKNIGYSDERFIDLFDIPDNVHLAIDESYQDLLNNSSVLITDYSSVFFDFAYLKKPVIYYHPNDDYHYEKSYFDYNTMGFGDIVKTESDLIDKLDDYIKNDCEMEDEYKKRVDEFFTYTDKNNSKRVYDWIKKN
ncbi:CDP-glycerol:glycerophosphate glycerophosphotransferase [Methanobrevibacter sp.]|uniref:CDP-glycerol:glycerophosphate glycerophosphotransferase n=1 Tax=Methanobrevibacter sp. TaxID=66852 RepID=UPI003865C8F5